MTNPLSQATPLMCRRDAQGRIVALTRQALNEKNIKMGAWQAVTADSSEVEAFIRDVSDQALALSKTDIGLARVLEDLIDALINRGLLQFTDLPAPAQAKLLERRETRAHLTNHLQLLPLDDDQALF